MRRAFVRCVIAAVVALATAAAPAFAQSTPVRLLDVPYVPQSEALCGGAATAMVMRFWGATGIYAEHFSSLLDRRAGGIRGEDLLGWLHGRGWQAVSFAGDAALIRKHLLDGRPPIALIEDRPGRYHYVVVLGWTPGKVVVHDPARAPFRVFDEAAFLRAWSRAKYWALLALPPGPAAKDTAAEPANEPVDRSTPTPGACGSDVDEAVRSANAGRLSDAERLLTGAVARCPGEVAPWRESAGLRALQKDWPGAATLARRALSLDPKDEHAARTLATSLYLAGDSSGALRAWNVLGEPAIDLVEIRGLERTRFSVASDALGLRSQTRLTSGRLTRAARRLDALPSVLGSQVSYTPLDHGLARVTAAVIERPILPSTALALGAVALRAGTDREVRVNLSSPTGGGELWHAAWRWWDARPRISAGIEAPSPIGGTWSLIGVDERETFGRENATFESRRRFVALTAADWVTASLAWQASVVREEWSGRGTANGILASLRYQSGGDRLVVRAHGGAWAARDEAWTASASADVRTASRNEGTVWLARVGGATAARTAPLTLWSGAGTGQGRDVLLRAHPLLHDGAIRDGVFGRSLAHGGVEWRRWRPPVFRVLRLAPAVFVDVARAFDTALFTDARAHVDAGAGLRVAIPGAGVFRADLARGLRDGEMALSFGWTR